MAILLNNRTVMSGPRWGHPCPWSLHATVYGFLFSNPWRLIKGKQDVPSVKSNSHLKLMKTLLCYSVTCRSLPMPYSPLFTLGPTGWRVPTSPRYALPVFARTVLDIRAQAPLSDSFPIAGRQDRQSFSSSASGGGNGRPCATCHIICYIVRRVCGMCGLQTGPLFL